MEGLVEWEYRVIVIEGVLGMADCYVRSRVSAVPIHLMYSDIFLFNDTDGVSVETLSKRSMGLSSYYCDFARKVCVFTH